MTLVVRIGAQRMARLVTLDHGTGFVCPFWHSLSDPAVTGVPVGPVLRFALRLLQDTARYDNAHPLPCLGHRAGWTGR